MWLPLIFLQPLMSPRNSSFIYRIFYLSLSILCSVQVEEILKVPKTTQEQNQSNCIRNLKRGCQTLKLIYIYILYLYFKPNISSENIIKSVSLKSRLQITGKIKSIHIRQNSIFNKWHSWQPLNSRLEEIKQAV